MVVVSLLYGCGSGSGDAGSSNGNGGSASEVPRVPAPGAGRQVFTELAIQSGLVRTFGFMDPAGTVAEKMGSGLAAVDYDNDGDIDLYVVSGDVEPNRLFQNQGDGSFIDVAASVGLDLLHKGSGPTFADIDNDGDLDLFVGALNGDRYYLMENRDGMFVDITAQSGISLQALNTFSATFCDYDLDQDLDLFLSHWGNTERQDTETVWRNNGDGTFESDSIGSGIARSLLKATGSPVLLDYTFTPNCSDIDGDGDMDLLFAADLTASQVFVNKGDGTFVNTTDRNVITDEAGMGASVGDYDNDGDMDWFVTSIYQVDELSNRLVGTGNRLYRNNGDGVFEDVTRAAGVEDGGWGWGSCFADFDNDANLDIFHVNGWDQIGSKVKNDFRIDQVRYFHSNGDGTFVNRAQEVGLTDRGQGRGVACFDADRDGDLDIVLTNNDDNHLVYYRNDSINSNHYLAVKLAGYGVGARVTVQAAGTTQVREMRLGNNFVSQNPIEVHFGLGAATVADVDVRWPGGSTTRLTGVAVDQLLTITQPTTNLRLVVGDGTGDGFYNAGDVIPVEAEPPLKHYKFSHWSSSAGGSFADASAAATTFTMPAVTVRLTANYLPGVALSDNVSVARRWNEVLLQAIRNDFARPTVHARNLFHISAALYDAWAAYDDTAVPWLLGQTRAETPCARQDVALPAAVEAAREQAMSFAAYRLIRHRFAGSPGASRIRRDADTLMAGLGYAIGDESTDYSNGSAAALGNHIAACYLALGLVDGSNEANGYANVAYAPVNPALEPAKPGNPEIVDRNRWQPLSLVRSIDQAGNPVKSQPDFLGPEWGQVMPFALSATDLTIHERDGYPYRVYHDPGPPPTFDGPLADNYQWTFSLVAIWSSHLDPTDGALLDISPASLGNIQHYPGSFTGYGDFYDTLNGGDSGRGYAVNPVTGAPYAPQIVPRGDYTRVLAEFWADGPDSETPPGHWFVILNEVNDHPLMQRRFAGMGPALGFWNGM